MNDWPVSAAATTESGHCADKLRVYTSVPVRDSVCGAPFVATGAFSSHLCQVLNIVCVAIQLLPASVRAQLATRQVMTPSPARQGGAFL